MYLFENKGESLDPSGFQVEACCNLKKRKVTKIFFKIILKNYSFCRLSHFSTFILLN